MFARIKNLFRPKLTPLNTIEISQKHILNNYKYLQSLRQGDTLFPVIKSNAYGHGLEQITKILDTTSCPYLVVDSLPEFFLAKKFTDKKFLLLGETLSANYKKIDPDRIALAVYNVETMQALVKMKQKFRVHLFLNTGMHREGVDDADLTNILRLLQEQDTHHRITIEGVMSHFATADETDPTMMHTQIEQFKTMHHRILEAGHSPLYRHIGNSAGMMTVSSDFFNARRPGIALYGYNPLTKNHPDRDKANALHPALDVYSTIVSCHDIEANTGISYNHTWKSEDATHIATVPFGYAEGLPRNLSNTVIFTHKKYHYPQRGTICMNLCSCEMTSHKLNVGDRVQIYSSDKTKPNSIEHIAHQAGTICYEILVRLDKGMRRKVV